MDSPWITFGSPDKSREYFAVRYYRPLNKYRAIPGFLRFAPQIQKQLRSTPGIIGYPLRAKLLSRNLDSLCLGPTKSTKWNVLCSALPLGWEEAMQRSKKGEPS